MVEWVLIHLHTRLLLWEEIDVIQYRYCWCESSGISWRCRTLAYQKLWRGDSLATKVPPKRLGHWAAAALDTPVGWWLVRGLYNPISWWWSEWGASWIPYSSILNGISGFEHCEICYSLVHPGHLHPFAPFAGGDDDNDFMRRGRFRDNRWVLRPEYLAGRGVWDSCGATLHNGATVETAQFRANLGEKGEPSGLWISMHLTDIKRGIGSAYHDSTD